jgi:arabinofuranosyltransferase
VAHHEPCRTVAGLLLVSSVWQPNFKHTIDVWHTQVNDLADTGKWLRGALPPGTVIATFANGALSYEAGTEITVVDVLGLTDEHIARDGKRDPAGMIGHQAQDYPYVINERRPSLVFMSGSGFAKVRSTSCHLGAPFADRYRALLYRVVGHRLWVTVLVRKDEYDQLVPKLDRSRAFAREDCPA